MKNQKQLEKLGIYTAFVLRHGADDLGLDRSIQGWVDVTAFLTLASLSGKTMSIADLVAVVESDDKGRFAFNADRTQIRALQGHSMPIDLGLENATPPARLYHGTESGSVASIMQHGVKRQRRHAVHLSASPSTATDVGSRHGPPMVLVVDAEAMHRDGYTFQISDNGVWLTQEVPSKYVSSFTSDVLSNPANPA